MAAIGGRWPASASGIQTRLRTLIHDRRLELEVATGCLDNLVWLERPSGRLSRVGHQQEAHADALRRRVRTIHTAMITTTGNCQLRRSP